VGGGTFDIGTWIPNQVISWSPSVQSLDLEINNSPASSQSLQNLVNSGTVTVVDNGGGNISFAAAAGGMPTPDEAQWRLWEATSNSNTTFNGYG
jgi:hypothetical protein